MEQQSLYCGIDVSKGRAEAGVLKADESRLGKTRMFLDTPEGREKMERWLCRCIRQTGAAKLEIGLEPTGGYEVHWVRSLKSRTWPAPVRVRLLPTTVVRAQHNATGQRTCTDSTSAWALAEALRSHPKVEVIALSARQRSWRRWIRQTEKIRQQAQSIQNELLQVLYETMPFMVSHIKDDAKWVLLLLKNYPTAAKLAKARKAESIPHAPVDKVRQLQHCACQQCRQLPSDELSGENVKWLAEELLRLNRRHEQERENIGKWVRENPVDPAIQRMCSIPYFGAYTAAAVYAEACMGKRWYPSAEAMVKFMGMDLAQRDSGDKQGPLHLSKKGPSSVRRLLYLAAWRLSQHVPVFQEYYRRQLARNGGQGTAATVAVMRKLIRIIWKLINDNVDFDGEYEARWKKAHAEVRPRGPQIPADLRQASLLPQEQLQQAPLSRYFRKKVKAASGRKRVQDPVWSVTEPPSPASDTAIGQGILYPQTQSCANSEKNETSIAYAKKPT